MTLPGLSQNLSYIEGTIIKHNEAIKPSAFRMFVSRENALLWMTSKKQEKLQPWPKRFARQLADLPNE